MANMYNKGMYYLSDSVAGGRWNDAGLTIKCALVTAAYVFDPTHNVWGDITHEVTNGGYVAGGNTVTGRTCTEDDVLNRVVYDATDVTFTALAAGDQPAAAIIYQVGAGSNLISYNIFTLPPSPDGNDFIVTWHATNGVFTLTCT